MSTKEEIAGAFSGHRFAETYGAWSDDIVWIVPGHTAIVGREAVRAACDEAVAGMEQTETTVLRFLVIAGDTAAAVDSVTRYRDPYGAESVVSSSDIYEFAGDRLVAITSYAVELDAADLGPTAYVGAS